MRVMLTVLFLLSGCKETSNVDAGAETGNASATLSGTTSTETTAERTARLQGKVDAALGGVLREPRYTNLREGPGGAVCGEVDSRQSDGEYSGPRPLVVTPEGVPLVSITSQIMFEDPDDIFPDFYIRWCASPEEMRTIGPLIESRANAAPAPDPIAELPAPDDPPLDPALLEPQPPTWEEPASPTPEPKASPTPPDRGAVRRGDEDSFLKSVIRNSAEPKSGQ